MSFTYDTLAEVVLHQPTGVLYLACSTPSSRSHWTPAVGRLNSTGASYNDYVAIYDPLTSRVTHLQANGYDGARGLSLHGMDVVPSSTDSSELYIYLVNHRKPLGDQPAHIVGADSSIEIFKTIIGTTTITHLWTVEDPVIIAPNDVVGTSDGQSFYFTNDHGQKTGLVSTQVPIRICSDALQLRNMDLLGQARASVGYCNLKEGCKFAVTNMHGNNGITKAPNNTFYVANSIFGGVTILEQQSDNTLVLTDVVRTGDTAHIVVYAT